MTTSFKDLMNRNKKFIGTYMFTHSETEIEIMKAAGFDYLIFDLEHERLTFTEILPMIRCAEACGMASVVRIPDIEEGAVKKALDIGATNIRIPNVTCAADAAKIVDYAKYPPLGHRGACPFVRSNGYGADRAGCYERANKTITLSAIVEGPEGIRNLEEIIAVPGIDTYAVGHVDLSVALGVPGQIFHPDVIDAVIRCADLCQKYGKVMSAQIERPEDIRLYRNHPAITHFITDQPTGIFYKACKTLCDEIGNVITEVEK